MTNYEERQYPRPDSDTNPSQPCVHCSLITSSSSEDDNSLDMVSMVTYLVPGLFYTVLGVRWTLLQIVKWSQEAKYCQYQEAGLPPPPEYFMNLRRRHFPWEGFVKIVLSILCIIVTSAVHSSVTNSNILLVNIYIFFTISGLTDLIIFYNGYKMIPEGLQSLILAGCFTVTALSYGAMMTSETRHPLTLLLILTSLNTFSALLETTVDNRLIKFCRAYFTLLQGSWLIQISSTSLSSLTWVTVVFTWHSASLFLLYVLLLVICQRCTDLKLPPQSENTSARNDISSGAQLVPCKMIKMSSLTPDKPMIVTNNDKSPSVVDVEPWDNVQYSSLSKNF